MQKEMMAANEQLNNLPMLEFQDWGLIEYEVALERQLELVQKVQEQKLPGFVVFCSHPPVVTLGRKTQVGDVFAWDGPVKEISRGGRATYHGPSQLVIYPIVNLEIPLQTKNISRGYHDISKFLRNFENAIVDTLLDFGISAVGKSAQKKSESSAASEETGVWVESRKVASLGLAVKNWVTYHGAAINLDYDPNAFKGMNPCGFSASIMISAEELLGRKIARQEIKEKLLHKLRIL